MSGIRQIHVATPRWSSSQLCEIGQKVPFVEHMSIPSICAAFAKGIFICHSRMNFSGRLDRSAKWRDQDINFTAISCINSRWVFIRSSKTTFTEASLQTHVFIHPGKRMTGFFVEFSCLDRYCKEPMGLSECHARIA